MVYEVTSNIFSSFKKTYRLIDIRQHIAAKRTCLHELPNQGLMKFTEVTDK